MTSHDRVAVVCFLPIVLEIAAIVFACIIRTGAMLPLEGTPDDL